ncbi:SNF2 family N-terminal domain-containing protein [Myxozyma melibiosi]|uniref:Helicase SWR1 n=1 Tax=Myxozyma melibiosi TaxID=54550 RepID=A0ABR1EZ34_9ASCO
MAPPRHTRSLRASSSSQNDADNAAGGDNRRALRHRSSLDTSVSTASNADSTSTPSRRRSSRHSTTPLASSSKANVSVDAKKQRGSKRSSLGEPAVDSSAAPVKRARVGRPPKAESKPLRTSSRIKKEETEQVKKIEDSDEDVDLLDEDGNIIAVPKIRIKYSVPEPIVGQPDHVPAPPKFGLSVESYLNSFKSLDDDVDDVTFEKRIAEEAHLRQKIENAVSEGLISELSGMESIPQKSLTKGFVAPKDHHSHYDHLISQAFFLSKLASDERRSHISRAKKIAGMVQTHFKKLSGADERERKAEEKRIRQLAKKTAVAVKRKWRLAEKVVRQRLEAQAKEKQRQAGKEQLNTILNQSTQLLEARKDQLSRDKHDNSELGDADDDMISVNSADASQDEDEDSFSEMDMSSDDEDESESEKEDESEDEEYEENNDDQQTTSATLADLYTPEELSAVQPSEETNAEAEAGDEDTSMRDADDSESHNEREVSASPSEQLTPPTPSNEITSAKSTVPTPFLLRGTLREYQQSGLEWLAGLYNNGTNGILADEMGLGKTIQTISLLSYLACEKQIWGPHLIVVPTSVMLNWEMEFKRFAPGFRILTYYGNPAQRKEKRKGWTNDDSWDVCITSYQLVIHDQVAFRRKQWQYMILDEAHNIKNFRSQRWQALLNFKAHRRLLLTGTPLQNNLMELWSLLYFLMPSSKSSESVMTSGFASLADFQEWFSHPLDKLIEGDYSKNDAEARTTISNLHKILRPYLLRRLKADVEKQMPAKYEHIVYCKLSKRQRYLYDDFMSRAQTRETLASGNFLSIINCLMQLRKVCNHPDLFEVRPIVTSFAMEKAAITSYETIENLVRKKLLRTNAQDSVDLEFLNLVPAHDSSISTIDSSSLLKLCASYAIKRDLGELEPDAGNLELPGSFSSLAEYKKTMALRRKTEKFHRLQHELYINDFRCQKAPIYGSNVLRLCDIRSENAARTRYDPAIQRTVARRMIVPIIERASQMRDVIDHYACVTPNVVALNMPNLLFSGIPEDTFLDIRAKCENPMHQAQVKLSIAFPDKRLLQFDCGKLQRLAVLLQDLKSGGHRALIFTQMTKVLDILEQFLNIHGYRYLRLDGATKIEQRQIMTERFNSDPRITVFILSTRSGGLGINLTGADTVIFYDSDWNPSMDKQCQDRCHRIGQTRDVHIYRLVSEYTIESNILRKANQKRMLDDIVIQEGEFTTDYFTKFSLSDMIGTEAAEELLPSTVNVAAPLLDDKPGGLEKALAMAEDEDDVVAAKIAMKESRVDNEDFLEQESNSATRDSTPVRRKDSASVSAAATPTAIADDAAEKAATEEPEEEEEENDDDDEEEEGQDSDDEDDDGFGSVDDYMIKFIEEGWYWD